MELESTIEAAKECTADILERLAESINQDNLDYNKMTEERDSFSYETVILREQIADLNKEIKANENKYLDSERDHAVTLNKVSKMLIATESMKRELIHERSIVKEFKAMNPRKLKTQVKNQAKKNSELVTRNTALAKENSKLIDKAAEGRKLITQINVEQLNLERELFNTCIHRVFQTATESLFVWPYKVFATMDDDEVEEQSQLMHQTHDGQTRLMTIEGKALVYLNGDKVKKSPVTDYARKWLRKVQKNAWVLSAEDIELYE